MKLAIMQPYFFPYIGYFQLINAVDKFVVYDNIEYTKKGWINRNRILVNGTKHLFSVPLKKDSDFLHINKRTLADNYPQFKNKLKGQIRSSYANSPHFKTSYPIIEECLDFEDPNLFLFILNSLKIVCSYLNIKTAFINSSTLSIDHNLRGEDKVIEINKILNLPTYIKAIGGVELYSKANFEKNNIELKFIKSAPIVYSQFNNEFVPGMSIIDVIMFNNREEISNYLNSYYQLV